jgi:hypothetical protein
MSETEITCGTMGEGKFLYCANEDCDCSIYNPKPGGLMAYSTNTDKEQAVLSAAEKYWRATVREGLSICHPSLHELIDAISSLRKSEAKRPDEVEPGTRFRFLDQLGEFLMVQIDQEHGHLGGPFSGIGYVYADQRDTRVKRFNFDSLLVPLSTQGLPGF